MKLKRTPFTSMVTFPTLIFEIVIALIALGVIGYAFLMMNEKQMKIKQDIDRTRLLRIRANEGRKGMNLLPERKRENIEQGRSIM